MDKKYVCYCGLYCENCAVKAKIDPAAKTLYSEMRKAGFEEIIQYIPGGDGFWPFLKDMAENGMCVSCQAGSGNPDCQVRVWSGFHRSLPSLSLEPVHTNASNIIARFTTAMYDVSSLS